MSERDPIWTEGSILADISDFSLLTSEEKETLLKFRGLYAKYMENEAIYRRFSRSEDEYDKALRMKALNDNLSMSSELYKLLGTSEIEHILELHSLGAFSGKKEAPAVETTTKTPKNVFCWKCGARLMDDGDFCVKCGANATTFDEGVNRTAAPAKSKPRFNLDVLASTERTTHWSPYFFAASSISSGLLIAPELTLTLSAPHLRTRSKSSSVLIPPPTVRGINISLATLQRISVNRALPSDEAVIS